jgi:ubiquinone/menaquinone biosynthesis C-methylase UbiE
MLFAETIARQARSPSGLLGRAVALIMGRETSPENDVAVGLLAPGPGSRILEVGCGHGQTLRKVARLAAGGLVVGLDGSATMLQAARRPNADAMRRGRVCLVRGDSGRLPWPDGRFDGVLAVHTIYFWREPVTHLRELRRVLRPSGRLVLCFRPKGPAIEPRRYPASVYSFHEISEVKELMRRAGFGFVEVSERRLGDRDLAWAVAQPDASSSADA